LLGFVERHDVEGAQKWLRAHLDEVSRQLQAVVAEMHGDPASDRRS
jgi:DNA-binding GntR family transcriptional regulator